MVACWKRTAWLPASPWGVWLALWSTVAATDFVVETTIVTEGQRAPSARFTTIFLEEQVYDTVQEQPDRATVIDFNQETVWLLDGQAESKQKLTFDTLVYLEAEASRRALQMSPLVQFAAAPEFAGRTWDPRTRTVRLTHEVLGYEAELDTDVSPDIAARYRAFADWSARLQTLSPGLPPHARLELNREIAIREAVPLKIRSRRQISTGQFETVESQHVFRRELTPADASLLETCQQWFQDFEERPWGE